MQQRPRRVFAYTRVSSDEQERSGTSLPAQRAELVAYCERRGWPAPTVIAEVESGSSEKLEERVELQRVLRDARAGDAIVVSRVDRWTRDMPSGVQYVRDLVKRGVGWFSVGENIDASETQGDSTLGIMAWTADNERKNIRTRTLGARRRMRDEGKWTEGRAPFGYRRCEVSKKLVVVEADAEVIREMFTRCIRGESIAQIGARFRARQIGRSLGGPVVGWDKKAVHRMLRSRWYMGEIRNTSGVWERVHDPIVDGTTFKRAQDAMAGRAFGGRRADPKSRTNEWLMRGLAVCGQCGARMGAAYGPRAHAHPYYACAARSRGRGCDQPYARVDAADALASAAAVRRLEELRDVFAEQGQSPEARGDMARLEALRRGLVSIIQRRERLVSLAIDGAITKDELKVRARKLDDERANSEAAIDEEEARLRPLPKETVASVLREVKMVRKAWGKATMPERREILAWLAERIVIDDGVPTTEWASAESVCASAVGRSLNGPTDAAPLNKLRKAGVR